MKVCIITPIYYPFTHGGLEAYAVELVQRLRASGHQVFVITLAEKDALIPDSGHGEIHQVGRVAFRAFLTASHRPAEWFATHLNEMFSSHGARAAREIIGRGKPDVIFSQAFYGFGRGMPRVLEQLGLPWLHYVHSYGLVCKRQTAMHRSGKSCNRQCIDCKWICRFKNGREPLRRAVTVYNSAAMKRFSEEAGIDSAESYVIDPVFSFTSGATPGDYHPAEPVRLAYVGRISPEKGVHLLCQAVASQPARYHLDVMGNGRLLEELILKHRDAPVTFHGQVPAEKRDALLGAAHALVVPSIWNEPYGRVVQEGFLAGLPVIAADVGAMGDMVRHGVDGFVFKWRAGREPESLAEALDGASPMLGRLRAGALETRTRYLAQDNYALIETLLLRAVNGGGELASTAPGGERA